MNPLEQAFEAKERQFEIFGQVLIDAWTCALVKGAGKVPFDPAVHKRSSTAIKIDIMPLPEQGITWPVMREYVDWEDAWVKFTLKSLKELGVLPNQLPNAFAKVCFVNTGETYPGANGETKEKSTFKFLAIYPDEATCRAAYEAEHGNGNGHVVDLNPQPQKSAVASDPATRAKLLPFAKMIVRKAVEAHPGDLTAICDEVSIKIAEHGTLKNFFTATDDDVMAMITDLTTAVPA